MSGNADPGTPGKGTTTRARLDRGRGALGPALELVHTGRAPTRAVRAALVGLGGRIVATTPGCEVVDADPAKVLGSVVAAGAELLRETGRRCVGAGLAVPSAVAEPEGLALNPLHLAWPAGAPVREI